MASEEEDLALMREIRTAQARLREATAAHREARKVAQTAALARGEAQEQLDKLMHDLEGPDPGAPPLSGDTP